MKSGYDAIVVGAGIGGLFAALELSTKGKRVLLLEAQPVPGGFATQFRRRGFTFESSLHCVDGLGKDQPIRMYLQMNAFVAGISFLPLKEFARISYPQHDFLIDADVQGYKKYLLAQFPGDKSGIERLFLFYERFYREFDAFEESSLPEAMRMLLCPFLFRTILKTSLMSVERLLNGFVRSPQLKAILADHWRFLGLPPSELSAFYFLVALRGYYFEKTAYVRGGYPQLVRAIVETLRTRGAEILFKTTVNAILTDGRRRVRGVRTGDGTEYLAPVVVSNVNVPDTVSVLLDDARLRATLGSRVNGMEKSVSIFQVYLGLNRPAKDLGMSCPLRFINPSYDHEASFAASVRGDYAHAPLGLVDHAQVDATLVPEGKGSLIIMVYDSFRNWQSASIDRAEYERKKEAVCAQLIARAQAHLPGLAAAIEVREAATPLTMQRYTHAPEGAVYGFAQTIAQSSVNRFPQKLAVSGLFLAGAWTFPGAGMHGCFHSGLEAASLALRYLSRAR